MPEWSAASDGEMFDSKLKPSTCGCAATTFCSYASLSASRDCATTTFCNSASLSHNCNSFASDGKKFETPLRCGFVTRRQGLQPIPSFQTSTSRPD